MPKALCLIFLLVFTYSGFAQKSLYNSRQSSFYTYIYRIGEETVEGLYKGKKLDEAILKFPVDSFLTTKGKQPYLPHGNYLNVHVEKNELHYSLIENSTAYLKLLDNRKNLQFVLVDPSGKNIRDAQVSINGHTVNFDAEAGLWHTNYPRKEESLVRVYYNGCVNYSEISFDKEAGKKTYSPKYRRYKVPKPIGDGIFSGYMVFNKPMYKPFDSVKFKAFILKGKKHKPVERSLKMRLTGNGLKKDLGEIKPVNKGSYNSSIVLHDSLKLSLDRNYTIELYDQEKVYRSGTFRYEEYELKSIAFAIRGDKKEHSRKQPQSLYFKATDENGLNIMDGRVELLILTKSVKSFNKVRTFVPDTLWTHSLKLDPLGETKLVLPDTIFPDADIEYQAEATFFNSNNERKNSTVDLNFMTEEKDDFTFEVKADSLFISLNKLYSKPVFARISAISVESDTLETLNLSLPAAIKINPFAKEYEVDGDSMVDWFDFENEKADLNASARKTADSLFIKIDNIRKIPFWYTIFEGNRILDRGYAVDLNYRKPNHKKGKIVFQYNYIWAGEPESNKIHIQLAEKELNLDVKQPLAVSPGEKSEIEVFVTDAKGKAVPDVDLTAYSLTSKFRYSAPTIPYYGDQQQYPKQKPELEADKGINKRTISLNWQRWNKELRLDSIAYFRFTHPDTIYRHEIPSSLEITQIAPFVMDNGKILPVEVLYLNDKPVYFSQAQQVNPYSFKVEPGLVYIKFRLKSQLVDAGSALAVKGKKLVISYNIDTIVNKSIKVSHLPSVLSDQEATVLNNYFIKVEDNYFPRFATIKQPDKVFLLKPLENNWGYNSPGKLIGPFSYNLAEFQLKGTRPVSFVAEPNYSYTFEPGLIKQRSIKDKYAFNLSLNASAAQSYKDSVLTNKEVDSLWLEYLDMRCHTMTLFPKEYLSSKGNGNLEIKIENINKDQKLPLIKSILVYRDDHPDFLNIYAGKATNLGYFSPGKYRVFLLLNGDKYLIIEDVLVKANGRNLLRISLDKTLAKDSISSKISSFIYEQAMAINNWGKQGLEKINETLNSQYIDVSSYTNTMSGFVFDEKNKEALPGVYVQIKGTNAGVSTDIHGSFSIKVPKKGKLVFRFIGYDQQEINVNQSSAIKVYLKESLHMLEEVTVVGYGMQKKSGYERSLQGKISGINVNQSMTGSVSTLRIRGINSITGDKFPLYIVDGIPMDMALKKLKPDEIAELSVLNGATATAIYGAKAANGVIIITTKKGKENAMIEAAGANGSNGLSIRKNFSDYAFWEPQLRTNAEGKVKFKVTFPDDITNWRTFFIAMNGKEQSGYTENSIKAFKPLSATFVSPSFAIAGDTFSPIGKILNYTTDTVVVKRNFIYNGKSTVSSSLSVKNSHIDTFKVVAEGVDSLKFQYSIEKTSGYADGEERSVPLYNAGVLESNGRFDVLETDTGFTLSFNQNKGKVFLRAETSVLPVLLDETEKLRTYEYLCNEQLASKLKALLAQKRIKAFLDEPFENDKAIKQLMKQLNNGRRNEGTWGWWKNSDAELWISLHAIEAYLEAEKFGYVIPFNKQELIDYLVYQLSSYKGLDKLHALILLQKMDAKVDYKTPLALYEKEPKRTKMPLYEKLKLIQLKQQIGLPITTDSLITYRHYTMFGNMFFGDNNYKLFDNSIQNSLLAYHIIKREGKHPEWLAKIRNFLLEQRGEGSWRNTYESSLILETLLPDLLKGREKFIPATLTLTASKKEKIDKFPYTTTLDAGTSLQVQKQGDLPVYLTAYQQFWNSQPQKVSKDFIVDTWFENKTASKVNSLKGGQPIVLKVEVTASADADFVMVEIPIPAGCSYDEKEQSWWGQEVHREYYKNKVSIFCRKLKEGKQMFSVKLMPRYDGNYTLNPAKAEMMYFPMFYGRDELRKVKIGE